MTVFSESDVVRDNAGRFGEKHHTAPEANLTPVQPARAGARFADRERDFGGFSLSKVKAMRGHEGTAWSADLKRNGQTVGHIVQDGNGGGTYARWVDPEARKAMETLGESDAWSDHPYVEYGAEELVLDELFAEHEAKKRLTSARRRGELPIMLADDVELAEENHGLVTYKAAKGGIGDEDDVREHLRGEGNLDGAVYFDGSSWVPFE